MKRTTKKKDVYILEWWNIHLFSKYLLSDHYVLGTVQI